MYDALYTYCATQAAKRRPRVLFVCLHGAATSVVGAAHFRRLAAARGLQIDAAAAGTEPDENLTPRAVKGLEAEGLNDPRAKGRAKLLDDTGMPGAG